MNCPNTGVPMEFCTCICHKREVPELSDDLIVPLPKPTESPKPGSYRMSVEAAKPGAAFPRKTNLPPKPIC